MTDRPTASSVTDDQLEQLHGRLERLERLLRETVALADVTHAYAGIGGHDNLGPDWTCAGCALHNEIRHALAEGASTR